MYVACLFFSFLRQGSGSEIFGVCFQLLGFGEGCFFFLRVCFNCVSLLLLPIVFNSSFRREVSAVGNSDDMYKFLHFLLAKGELKKWAFCVEWKVMLLLLLACGSVGLSI